MNNGNQGVLSNEQNMSIRLFSENNRNFTRSLYFNSNNNWSNNKLWFCNNFWVNGQDKIWKTDYIPTQLFSSLFSNICIFHFIHAHNSNIRIDDIKTIGGIENG